MQLWEIHLGLESSSRFAWFFSLFLLIFSVSSSNIFLVFFSTFYGIFHSFWKKKHMLPKVFFQALSNLVFYEDFYFWIKYKHQMFFVPCYNFFWKLGHLKPQVLWVTSQLVESSIVFKIVYFDFFSIFFFSNCFLHSLFFYLCSGLFLWSCGLRNF